MKSAVLDASPLIHLEQINALHATDFINEKIVSQTVKSEIGVEAFRNVDAEVKNLSGEEKDRAKYLTNRYGIDLGEATSLVLCKQLNVDIVLTDDLDARDVARNLELEPHGTLGVLTRAYSKDIISEKEAKEFVRGLKNDSTLFITTELSQWAIDKIESS